MKLYCYYFKTDGSVEKERIICRKNKSEYAFNYISETGYRLTGYVSFEDIGKVLDINSFCNGSGSCCRIYLEENEEITENMKVFSKKRVEKLEELKMGKDRIYKDLKSLKSYIEKRNGI